MLQHLVATGVLARGRHPPKSPVAAPQQRVPSKAHGTSVRHFGERQQLCGSGSTATLGGAVAAHGLPTVLLGTATLAMRRRRRHPRRTILAQGPMRDAEVKLLERAAEQARGEAAKMEAELLQRRCDENLKWFKLFDVNGAGMVTASDLQQGMLKLRGLPVDEDTAKRLLEKHDANHDGVLQAEEFNIEALNVALDVFREEAAAREAERQAAEQRRLEEQQTRLLELASLPPANEDAGLLVRLGSTLAYALPLLDSLHFGAPLAAFIPMVKDVMAPLYAAYYVLNILPVGPIFAFLGLQATAENVSLPRLLRFNFRQALEMDIAVALLNLFIQAAFFLAFGSSPEDLAKEIGSSDDASIRLALLANILVGVLFFLTLAACIAYSVVASVLGFAPDGIPFISGWAHGRLKPTRPKDCTVHGPQLDPSSAGGETPSA